MFEDKDFSNAKPGAFEHEIHSITHTLRKFGFDVQTENFEQYGIKGITAFHVVDPEHNLVRNYIAKLDTSGITHDEGRWSKAPHKAITTPKQGIADLAYLYRKSEIPIPDKYVKLLVNQNLNIAKVDDQVIVYEQSDQSIKNKVLTAITGKDNINPDTIHIVMGYQDHVDTHAISYLTKEEIANSKTKLVAFLNHHKNQVNSLQHINRDTTKSNFVNTLNSLDSKDKIQAFAKELTTGKQAQANVRAFERNVKQLKDVSEHTRSIIKDVKKVIRNEMAKSMGR